MSEFSAVVVSVTGKDFLDTDSGEVERIAAEVGEVRERSAGPVVVCVGGGELKKEDSELGRVASDKEGMLRSILHASELIKHLGRDTIGFSGVPTESLRNLADFCEKDHPLHCAIQSFFYDWQPNALSVLQFYGKDGLLVAGGGVGHPYVRTDLAGSLWAASLITNDPDSRVAYLKSIEHERLTISGGAPETSLNSFGHIDYETARNLDLPILDPTAWPILEGNHLTTLLYKEGRPGSIPDALDGISGTIIEVLR